MLKVDKNVAHTINIAPLSFPSYEECLRELRRKVFSLEKGNLTTAKVPSIILQANYDCCHNFSSCPIYVGFVLQLSEKGWVNLASKTWDAIRNSPFYMEYSRLLP